MKTLYDFAYCPGVLTPSVRWFLVKVGSSEREQRAAAYVGSLACNDRSFLWCRHSAEWARFKERVFASIAPADQSVSRAVSPGASTVCVSVLWLAAFLRRSPAALLNSPWLPVAPSPPLRRLAGLPAAVHTRVHRETAKPKSRPHSNT